MRRAKFIQMLTRCLVVLAIFVFVLAGMWIDYPYVSAIRMPLKTAIVWGAPLLATILFLALRQSGGGWSNVSRADCWLLCLLLASPLALGITLAQAMRTKERVLATPDNEERTLGRHFMIGFSTLADVETLAARGLIGGIFIAHHNMRHRGLSALRSDIAHLQNLRKQADLPPLIVAADQEGGLASRLTPPLTRFPALAAIADRPSIQRAEAARAQGLAQGKELADRSLPIWA